MKYRHLTLSISLEGLSPTEIISGMKKEGFKPLFSEIVTLYSNFLNKKSPFEKYKKIIVDKNRNKQKILNEDGTVTTVYLGSDSIKLESFGELFKHENYPEILFGIYDSTNSDKKEMWFFCWSIKEKSIDDPFDTFVTTVLKIIGCDKCVEDIMNSDTFSFYHKKILSNLNEYDLKTTRYEEKKLFFHCFLT